MFTDVQSMAHGRWYPTATTLGDGRGSGVTSRLFDPSAHTWSTVANTQYPNSRTYGGAVLLPMTPENNYAPRVMIMGGGTTATATTEIIDLGASTPTWQFGPNMSGGRIEMNAVILPNGKVLAMGGSSSDENESTASDHGGRTVSALRYGQPAPAFSLPSTSGTTVSLTDLRGQDVVLAFYCFDWGSI